MTVVLNSGGLNPSNAIAEQVNGGRRVFPNLARRVIQYNNYGSNPGEGENVLVPSAQEIFAEVDAQVLKELAEAGMPKFDGTGNIGAYDMAGHHDTFRKASNGCYKEVPTGIVGFYLKWKFERAWYYYVASGAGIPPEFAAPFDKEWGKEVRANGDCACRGAEFWGEGFGIGMYHIDTQRGLNAFVGMLRKIHRPYVEHGK